MRALPTAVLSLALLCPAALPGATAPARADDPVAAATRSVADLRHAVDAATGKLLTGTRRLEADRSRLATVWRRATSARRAATDAERQVVGTRTRLGIVAAAAYRHPAPDDVALALGSGPDVLRELLVARADLDHVRGREQELLRSATADRVRSRDLLRTAQQLEQDARRRERTVAREVGQLQALADRTRSRLEAADARLRRVRAARTSAVVRAVGAGSALRGSADGGSCAGGATDGAPNGFLPEASLCPIGGGNRLRADAAGAFLRMAAARPLCVTDSYRSYGAQVAVFARKPELAAVPGTSNHGLGLAVDLGCGAERFGSDAFLWLTANAGRFGWHHPAWAEPGGGKPEPWHWEYGG